MYLQNIPSIFYSFTYELKQKPLFLRTSRKQESTFSYLFRTKPYIPISPHPSSRLKKPFKIYKNSDYCLLISCMLKGWRPEKTIGRRWSAKHGTPAKHTYNNGTPKRVTETFAYSANSFSNSAIASSKSWKFPSTNCCSLRSILASKSAFVISLNLLHLPHLLFKSIITKKNKEQRTHFSLHVKRCTLYFVLCT